MFSRVGTFALRTGVLRLASVARAQRSFGSSRAAGQFNVTVAGAAGGIGQPLSLLLKQNQDVAELRLFDIVNTPGVAADISHVPSPAKVTGHTGEEEIGDALAGSDVVVIPAGIPRKPGMTRDDLFNTNASIVQGIIKGCAKYCPEAFLLIISNPVNSTVPIAAETLKAAGVYNPKRLFGVTTLDVCRANTFVAENQNMDVNDVDVTVVGGHAGTTIMPLLSQVEGADFSNEDIQALTKVTRQKRHCAFLVERLVHSAYSLAAMRWLRCVAAKPLEKRN